MTSAITIILTSLIIGYFLKTIGRWKISAAKILNEYVIDIAFPALVFSSLPNFLKNQGMRTQDLLFPLAPWILIIIGILFFMGLHKLKLITKAQCALLVCTCGFANTSFIGFPMLEGLMGKDIIPLAVILDVFGTFLAFTFIGIIWITWQSAGKKPSIKLLGMRLIKFPPFLALIFSFPLSMISVPESLQLCFVRIGQTLVPVAMVAVGLQLDLNLSFLKKEWKPLLFGMSFRLILSPLIFMFLYAQILGVTGRSLELVVLEMSMAPMITSSILAMEAELEPRLGALCLGLGIPLSLVTVPHIQKLLF